MRFLVSGRGLGVDVVDGGSLSRGSGRGVLDGAFGLLDVLAHADRGVGLSEAARKAGLPKASAYRLLERLVQLGAAERCGRRYLVGWRLARLGAVWQPEPWLTGAARGPVRLLARLARSAACVTVPYEERIRLIAGTRGIITEIPQFVPGDEFCIETAAGQALLLARRATGEDPPRGLTIAEWRQARASFRRSGSVVLDHQGVIPGISCVAAPVWDPDGEVIASVSVFVIGRAAPVGLTALVVRASREITRNLAVVTPVH